MPNIVGFKETSSMNRTSSSIASVLDGIKSKLAVLDKEIKDDKKGKKDYEDELHKLNLRREELVKRLEQNKTWEKHFDKDIEPLEKTYTKMTADMNVLYGDAKLEHARGLQVLMNEFMYHPEFKRWNDEFTAVPFRPK